MGYDEDKALEAAKEYLIKREAIYMEAVSNGYSATDEEVWEYLDTLKETINSAENSEDIISVIEQFDSEEDFWNYEFIVYKKDLPAQNYISDMEDNYDNNALRTKSSVTDAASDAKSAESWEIYFETLKDGLEEKYEDEIVFE